MAVIVSSSITKSGSTISGDVKAIVVVQTDPRLLGQPRPRGHGQGGGGGLLDLATAVGGLGRGRAAPNLPAPKLLA